MAFADKAANTRRAFTIIDKSTNNIAGSMSMGNISMNDLRLEIGWSWLGKSFRGTGINRHSKYCMMKYAFDELNFERVEFKTDVLNLRARKGLEKIGGKEEGILRSHMTMWNNRRRDSVYYSVLKNEWPLLKQTIFKDIERENENYYGNTWKNFCPVGCYCIYCFISCCCYPMYFYRFMARTQAHPSFFLRSFMFG